MTRVSQPDRRMAQKFSAAAFVVLGVTSGSWAQPTLGTCTQMDVEVTPLAPWACSAAAYQSGTLYLGYDADPSHPQPGFRAIQWMAPNRFRLGEYVATQTGPTAFTELDGLLAVAVDSSQVVQVFDVSDPMTPTQMASIETGFVPTDLAAIAGHLFVSGSALQVYDLADPTSPTLVTELPVGGKLTSDGSLTFASSGHLLDTSAPGVPEVVASGLNAHDAAVLAGSVLYTIDAQVSEDYALTIYAIDVTSPANPVQLSSCTAITPCCASAQSDPFVAGGRLYWQRPVADLADPLSPTCLITGLDAGNVRVVPTESGFVRVDTRGSYTRAIRRYEYGEPDPILVDSLPALRAVGAGATIEPGSHIFAAEEAGDVVGGAARLVELQMRDGEPVQLGLTAFRAFSVTSAGGHVFAGGIDGWIHAAPWTQEGGLAPLTPVWNAGGVGSQLATQNGMLYVGLPQGGLQVLSIADPGSPELEGEWEGDGAVAISAFGDRVAMATGDYETVLLDVSDPTAPTLEARVPADGSESLLLVGDRLLAGSDLGDVWIFDISDPSNATPLGAIPFAAFGVHPDGQQAWIADGQSLWSVDMASPAAGRLLRRFVVPGSPTELFSAGSSVKAFGEAVVQIDPSQCETCGDLDGRSGNNLDDIDLFVSLFFDANPTSADLTGNGAENLDDLDAFVAAFVSGCP